MLRKKQTHFSLKENVILIKTRQAKTSFKDSKSWFAVMLSIFGSFDLRLKVRERIKGLLLRPAAAATC